MSDRRPGTIGPHRRACFGDLNPTGDIANGIAALLKRETIQVAKFPDGAERLPGAETVISDCRTVLMVRLYRVVTDDFITYVYVAE
jgi:hypothetical protein